LLVRKEARRDPRITFLLAWLMWGVVFFSIFLNKLPGYLLPLLPAAAALMGFAMNSAPRRACAIALASSAGLLAVVPLIQGLLPDAIATGVSHIHVQMSAVWLLPIVAAVIAVLLLERVLARPAAFGLIVLSITLVVVRIVWQTFPVIDQVYSARPAWLFHKDSITCIPASDRSLRYGLDYYASRELPDCN